LNNQRNHQRRLLVLYALTFLVNLGYGVMIPTLSVHAHEAGASNSVIGVIVSAFALAQVLTQIPMGRLSDRVGRVYIVAAGFAVMALAATLYYWAATPAEFIALQALAGVGAGCLWPPLMAMLTDCIEPSERGRMIGIWSTVFFLGIGFGPLLGGFLSVQFGNGMVFLVWAASAACGGLLCLVAIRESAQDVKARAANTRATRVTGEPMILPGMLTTFAASLVVRSRGGVCTSFNNSVLPLYAVAMFDASTAMIGGIMFIHGLGLALFNIPGGILTDRVGRKLPTLVGSLVASAGVFWYCGAHSFWPLFAAVALAGAGAAFSTPALAALCADVANPNRKGEAFGYYLTSFNVGMVAGALVFGVVADFLTLWGAVLAWAIVSLILSLFAVVIREPDSLPNLQPAAART
jgi:MFS family permease